MEAHQQQSPSGLWDACGGMELVAQAHLTKALEPFRAPLADCYEAGTQVTTLRIDRSSEEDLSFGALFLKRTLNDFRSVWVQTSMGFTSQAAAVAASLFEHALSVETLAGSPSNVERLRQAPNGDLPWSPMQLAKAHAANVRKEAQVVGRPYSNSDFELAWREVYGGYKFLCKIKHPTIRSAHHDASSTTVEGDQYVVMAAPDVRPVDLPMKATILTMAIARTYQAVRWFALSAGYDPSHEQNRDFVARMARVVPATVAAYGEYSKSPLPFGVGHERVASEYRALKRLPEGE